MIKSELLIHNKENREQLQYYKKIAKESSFNTESIKNITINTFPTYRFLKQNFSLYLSKEERSFRRATSMIEFVSRIGLLKYLILSFKKNDNK